jgi:hypothetical protein
MNEEFSAAERQRLRRLLDIEEIRDVGMLYSQLQDNAYYERLIDIFTEDALCEFGPYGTWRGHEEIHRNYLKVYQDLGAKPFPAMHANSNHWVDVLSPSKAFVVAGCLRRGIPQGRRSLEDRPNQSAVPLATAASDRRLSRRFSAQVKMSAKE